MSSHGNNNESSNIRDRRGSFNPGSSLSDFLSSNRQPQPPSAYPGPITTAAAHANTQRRMSMSSVNGSPPQGPGNFSLRRGSVSSISSISSAQDESAIDDTELASGSPSSPFARRMSWGARALRDVRLPGSSRVPPSPSASSPTVSRGFWLDNKASGYPIDPAFQQRRQSMPGPPAHAMPAPKETAPDPLQERLLRNEFYMD
ncbi:hypothetical protein BZA05DRAFT_66391 [Tricharina praecox]|uniref:uncharacterized protein n=1 Tax=Tricharina praecox TaxID=43433 RepID=UPI00221F2DEE|nr:uncharacterized protein BZA05DRAFT_66391 [Tricharina praecox]KAI5850012.1 hypothetical protein BZA05DRAFT_66391 [Tricharina praecox]